MTPKKPRPIDRSQLGVGGITVVDPDQLPELWAEIQRMEREATEKDDLSDLDDIVKVFKETKGVGEK